MPTVLSPSQSLLTPENIISPSRGWCDTISHVSASSLTLLQMNWLNLSRCFRSHVRHAPRQHKYIDFQAVTSTNYKLPFLFSSPRHVILWGQMNWIMWQIAGNLYELLCGSKIFHSSSIHLTWMKSFAFHPHIIFLPFSLPFHYFFYFILFSTSSTATTTTTITLLWNFTVRLANPTTHHC